jgi:endonuclease/exonuclease/phosphatase family metal-dependent hydrolase
MKIRVATYNIHKGVTSFGGMPRIHALKQALTQLDADILFLQEVQGRHDRKAIQYAAHWPAMGQHEFLAGDSHYFAYGMNAVYDHGHHGNALLSRFSIIETNNSDISDHAYESRGILHCIIHVENVAIHCYVVHLGLLATGRQRQAAALVEAVRSSSPPDAPVIIAGDFNDWENKLSGYLRERLDVKEVFENQQTRQGWFSNWRRPRETQLPLHPARTFPAMLPWLRLDRIYLRGFNVDTAEVLRHRSWSKLSDHAPIVTMLELA